MLTKLLISCALFVVAAQAGYAQYGYGPSNAGYVANLQPAITVQVLQNKYGYAVPAYSSAYGSAYSRSYAGDVDGSALSLANLALALPSAGRPNPVVIKVPDYPTTSYSAPAVVLASDGYGAYGGPAISQSAAVATSNVKSAGSGYGPAQAAAASAY